MLHMSAIGSADASLSNYAKTKGWGEEATKAAMPNAVVFKCLLPLLLSPSQPSRKGGSACGKSVC
jgi:hypothetical protein